MTTIKQYQTSNSGIMSTVVHCDGNRIAAPTAAAAPQVLASGEL